VAGWLHTGISLEVWKSEEEDEELHVRMLQHSGRRRRDVVISVGVNDAFGLALT